VVANPLQASNDLSRLVATLLGNCFCFYFNEWSVGISCYHSWNCFLTYHSFQIITMKHYIRLTSNGTYYSFYCCVFEDDGYTLTITDHNNKGEVTSIHSFNWDTITMFRKFPHNPHYGKERREMDQSAGSHQDDGPNQAQSTEMGRGSGGHGPVRKAWQALVSFLDIDKSRQKV